MFKREVNKNGKFVIYSLPRCGSTTLMRIMNCIRDVQCLSEPFNLHSVKSPYAPRAHTLAVDKDILALREVIDEVWNCYTGIKHVWEVPRSQSENCPDLIEQALLTSEAHVLLLTRRNRLQRIVSFEISLQTNVWGFFNKGDREMISRYDFKPLRIESILAQLALEEEGTARTRDFLLKNGVEFLEVYYESLYGTSFSAQQRLATLAHIVGFTGHSGFSGERRVARIKELLDASNSKLNSEATYRLIPGIEEVDNRCGSDKDGWLFDDLRTIHSDM